MAAIIRVKRCLEDHNDALDAFFLECKKRKIDDSSSTVASEEGTSTYSTAVLKFAGTIKEPDHVIEHLKNKVLPNLDELKANFKKHTVNLTDKLRLKHEEASKNSRYKIVNCFRSPSLNTSEEQKEYTILDVETDINQNDASTVNKNSDTDDKYVYDLYYTNPDEFEGAQEYISIYPISDVMLGDNCYDKDLSDSDDSEDSNAECNWRNDYPDEDDLESINEDDMVEAMKNVDLDDDLSTDSDEERNVYDGDSDCEKSAVDDDDIKQYGLRYATFKAKYKNLVGNKSLECSDLYYGDF
ncbi:unnamed protein product [Phyllotreta striolata]|uniref:Probable RNA polymerase II nuclear localization protein SLC7A6OS n=1 Tax=Phyllotreta striolata TaxID=444603 RepID=A0A9N9TXZ4_PHYSR|nr:unnamed protein product [Phyllotreta striolata]